MALTTAITIAGNATNDPELRSTRDGKPVANVRVAVNPRTFDRDKKEWVDGEPVYWNAVAFGNMAEYLAHSVSKGNRVIVHGAVRPNTWTDKDSGVQRTEKEINIEEIGLSLLFTNAQVVKESPKAASRPAQGERQSQDDWASQGSWASTDDTPF